MAAASGAAAQSGVLGEYALYGEIAAGGMATVHFGRLRTPSGQAQTVAIKRLHPQFAKDSEFRTMFLDEARVAVHVAHPNVVPTLDVVGMKDELFIVMGYVPGESLSKLIRLAKEKKKLLPPRIAATVVAGALRGLHAAHIAKDAAGVALHIVHRDVSPQNILVGTDGVARVLDFGVAKAVGRVQQTREGQLKGKIAYMAPEQLNGDVSPRTDIYAAGVTLWEALTGRRLFTGDNEAAILGKIIDGKLDPPSKFFPPNDPKGMAIVQQLDVVVMRALSRDANARYSTALEMAEALEAIAKAEASEIARFTEKVAHVALRRRATVLAAIEKKGSRVSASSDPPPSQLPTRIDSTGSGSTPSAKSHPASSPSELSGPNAMSSPSAVSGANRPSGPMRVHPPGGPSSSGTPPAIEPSWTVSRANKRPTAILFAGAAALLILLVAVAVGVMVFARGTPKSNAIPPAATNSNTVAPNATPAPVPAPAPAPEPTVAPAADPTPAPPTVDTSPEAAPSSSARPRIVPKKKPASNAVPGSML